jgi:hydroxymethylbilane synthase
MTATAGAGALTLRLGTRRSRLALAQSGQVARALEAAHPGLSVELVSLVTRGDREPGALAQIGGKGLFTQELEAGLADGSLDLAVHSLKDLPVTLPEGLMVAAYPARADARDTLICAHAADVASLPAGASVLTGSLRRAAQLLAQRPDLDVRPVRGNVDTRLARWRGGDGDALVLAQAGLDRLGLFSDEPGAGDGVAGDAVAGDGESPAHPLDPRLFLPAPGQGTLALEVQTGRPAEALCRALDDAATRRCAVAERAVVAAFGGDCTLPLAAWARQERRPDGELQLRLTALLATSDGRRVARGEGLAGDPATAAEHCIRALREDGADEVLARLRRTAGAKAAPASGSPPADPAR